MCCSPHHEKGLHDGQSCEGRSHQKKGLHGHAGLAGFAGGFEGQRLKALRRVGSLEVFRGAGGSFGTLQKAVAGRPREPGAST